VNTTSISVSKLCCPVCWEFLTLLRGETDDFKVRGRHTTVAPVDLPAWVPEEVMKEMVERFRAIVRGQVLEVVGVDGLPPESAESMPRLSISVVSESRLSDRSDQSLSHVVHEWQKHPSLERS
jgi:hypothetical protein